MIGGLGDEVPQKQKLFSYQSTDSSSFCEFHYSKNLSVIGITKCEKKFDHRLGGAMAPCGPPWIRHLEGRCMVPFGLHASLKHKHKTEFKGITLAYETCSLQYVAFI